MGWRLRLKLVRITWTGGHTAILRDPRESGAFLRGIECNDRGIGVREGCVEDPELMIRLDRIESLEELSA